MDHASGGDLLERYRRAWETFDGDAWIDLFTNDAAYHEDPFEAPRTGHNALRAYLLDAAERQNQVEMTVERHWVVGTTVLAVWHASYVRRADSARVRMTGFMTMDIAGDGKIARFREWWHRRETPASG